MYDVLFEPIRDKVKNILEIGVQYGHSLHMWHDFFPNATIHGVDVLPISFSDERIKTYVGSQNDVNFLNTLCNTQYDIIIDDGSHINSDQNISLGVLEKFLVKDGFYIIEDILPGNDWVKWCKPKLCSFIGMVSTSPSAEQMLVLRRR